MRLRLAYVALIAFVLLSIYTSFRHAWPDPRDFGVRYGAGLAVREGSNPYNTAKLRVIINAQGGGQSQAAYAFLDPPPVASIFAVITTLPYRVAAYGWVALSIVASSAIAAACLRWIGVGGRERWVYAVALALAFSPTRYGVAGVQLDPMLAATAIGGVILAEADRDIPAGILLALALLKPQVTGIAIFVFLIAVHRRSLITSFTATLAALSLLPVVTRSSASWPHWIHALSVAGVHASSPIARSVSVLTGLCLVGLVLAGARSGKPALASFALAAAATPIFFATVHFNMFSAALLLVPVAFAASIAARGSPLTRWVVAVALALVAVGALEPSVFNGGPHAAAFPLLAAGLAAFALLCLGIQLRYVAVGLAINASVVVAGIPASKAIWLLCGASVAVFLVLWSGGPTTMART